MIYGRVGNMKRMRPLSGDTFALNRIQAEMFTPTTQSEVDKLLRELSSLQNQGEFELRKI